MLSGCMGEMRKCVCILRTVSKTVYMWLPGEKEMCTNWGYKTGYWCTKMEKKRLVARCLTRYQMIMMG